MHVYNVKTNLRIVPPTINKQTKIADHTCFRGNTVQDICEEHYVGWYLTKGPAWGEGGSVSRIFLGWGKVFGDVENDALVTFSLSLFLSPNLYT